MMQKIFLWCGHLARFLDIREQDAPTTNFIFAKLGCSQQFSCGAGILPVLQKIANAQN
jgi:hypothetical protein